MNPLRSSALLLASISATALLAASPATAQSAPVPTVDPQDVETAPSDDAETPEDAGEVVVTGSRIPRPNLESGQPTLVLDSQIIEQRGYNNIADALQDLPSFGVPGSSRAGAQAGAFGSGQNFVNFFGLGDQRTLVIANGRRFVSSNTASIFGPTGAGSQVDLNVFPTLLIDRVETIAVGGAPIYGSDAIAGTVNIITKRKFEGVQLDAQYGITERGDAREYRVRGLAGYNFGDGRGNITIAGEYNKQAGLDFSQRPNARLNSFFTAPADPDSPFANILIRDRRIPSLSEFGVPTVTDIFPLGPGQNGLLGLPDDFQGSVTDAAGRPLTFDASGNLIPLDFGTGTGSLIDFEGGNGFVLPGNLLTPVRRYIGTALLEYELTDELRLIGEAWYANSRGNQLRDQPVYNTALFDAAGTPDGNLILSVDNPFLSPAARQTIVNSLATNPAADAPDTFYLGRANTDLISGAGASTVELYRFVGGLESEFEGFGRQLRASIIGNYGKSATKGRERVLVQQNFENAVNAVRDAGGNIVCAPGAVNSPVQTVSGTCAPLNPFGRQVSQAARDYVTASADPRAENEQWLVTASLSGNIFDIWGGPVGFALGYEHRDEKAAFDPGFFYGGQLEADGTRTQFGRSAVIDPVAGGFNTDEVFGELQVPLIGPSQNIPLVNSVELRGAARYIENSLAGGDWTYTGDVRWELFEGLALRGNYTRSVRAPAVTELFNPASQIFTTAEDPCDLRFITGGPNPANRAANCAADGLPANFRSNIVEFTARGSLSGNQNLQNETADARTIGLILRPRFLPGFSATVDWVDIELKNAIETLDADQTLEGCYDSPDFPTALCSQFDRDGAGQITFVRTGYANAASRDFQGLIAQVAYQRSTPVLGADSSVNIVANYQYTDKLEVRVGAGDLTTLRNSIGYSPHKGTVNASYRNNGVGLSLQWLYYGKTKNDPDQPDTAYEFPEVEAVSYFNGSLSFDVGKQYSLRFIVDNILDKGAPFPVPANGGTVSYIDGFIGRTFRAGATVRF
jgi:outer membrane receptor protein involved in Fe transport